MRDPLLTIGAFARAGGLSPSALRHYDECGLLRPADVDEATGYRYYTPDLVERAEMVSMMREAGLSIEQMRTVLEGDQGSVESVLQSFAADAAERSERIGYLVTDLLRLGSVGSDTGRCCVSLRGPELASALRQVRPAADQDAVSDLSGVVIDVVEGSLDVAATNRYWMAVRTLHLHRPSDPGRVVLSLNTAARLARALDGFDHTTVVIDEHRLSVGIHEYVGRTGAFPAHRIVIDGLDPVSTRAVISRDELARGVESAGRADVVLNLSPERSTLSWDDDRERIPVGAALEGPGLSLRLVSALLLRAIGATVGAEIEVAASTADVPVRISSPYQPGFVALVMPIGPRP